MRPLVWFRTDLRVDDNTALLRACEAATSGVVAVYHVATDQWREHGLGGNKVEFVRRNLVELSSSLAAIHIPLLLIDGPRFSDAPEALLRIAQQHECSGIWFNEEYEVNERERDEMTEQAFENAGLTCHRCVDQAILPPGDVRTGSGTFYSVFGAYKRKWLTHFEESRRPLGGTPVKQEAIEGLEPDPVPAHFSGFDPTADLELWPAGEEEARRRLEDFAQGEMAHYSNQRDLPAQEGTSQLSPYIAAGVISPRRCMEAAIEADGGTTALGDTGPGVWKTELIWREFYRHVLLGFPRVCMGKPFKADTDRLVWSDNESHFRAWCEGQTGYPIVDAAMRQLRATGWMHNRLRMVAAMFLTKDLFLDWRLGEAHFNEHLIDHDFALNNGGWQWSASTGTDAVPYFRVFNPFSQSARYDKEGDFINKYVPELAGVAAPALHDPAKLAKTKPVLDGAYPGPIVDRSKTKDRVVAAFKAL